MGTREGRSRAQTIAGPTTPSQSIRPLLITGTLFRSIPVLYSTSCASGDFQISNAMLASSCPKRMQQRPCALYRAAAARADFAGCGDLIISCTSTPIIR
jgi:hypothetical protein